MGWIIENNDMTDEDSSPTYVTYDERIVSDYDGLYCFESSLLIV